MRSHAGVASTMFEALASRGINILAISTSEIKVSVLIAQEYTEPAVRVLHTASGLDTDDTTAKASSHRRLLTLINGTLNIRRPPPPPSATAGTLPPPFLHRQRE